MVHSSTSKQTAQPPFELITNLIFITVKANKRSFLNNQPFLNVIATEEEQERKCLPASICSLPCVGSSSSLYTPSIHTPLPHAKPEAQNTTVSHISQARHTVPLQSLQQGTFIFILFLESAARSGDCNFKKTRGKP